MTNWESLIPGVLQDPTEIGFWKMGEEEDG